MFRENLGHGAGLVLFQNLNPLKEADIGLRVVAGTVHILHPQIVGLCLELAGKLDEGHRHGQRSRLVGSIAGPAANEDERYRTQLGVVSTRHAARNMVGANVGCLVGHHPGQLRLLLGVQNQAGINEEEPSRQRKRVDLIRIDDLDRERHLAVGILDDVLPHPLHIFHHHRIGDEPGALLDLFGVHPAHLVLIVGRVPVAHAPAPDVAIAHRAHVVYASRLHVDLLAAGLHHLVGIHRGSRRIPPDGSRSRRRLSRRRGNLWSGLRSACGGALGIGLCPRSGSQRQSSQRNRSKSLEICPHATLIHRHLQHGAIKPSPAMPPPTCQPAIPAPAGANSPLLI